jgi:hypothetical protein
MATIDEFTDNHGVCTDMNNLGQMLKQAREMQVRMQEMQAALGEVEVVGNAGAGMITVTLNGRGEMRGIRIDESLVDAGEKEMLEDLIVAAVNDARGKVDVLIKEKTAEIMGGMQLPPGMSLPM